MSDTLEARLARAAATLDPPLPDRDRLTRAARDEGLADVAYAVEDTPIGELLLAATPRGVVKVSFLDLYPLEPALGDLAARISPRVLEDPGALDGARRQLDDYFAGHRRGFDLPLDWRLVRGFGRKVLERTARIPYGQVETYGTVAREIGSPRAARATGNALGANPIPIFVPCHRVVRAGGVLGHYGGGPERKARLIELEGG